MQWMRIFKKSTKFRQGVLTTADQINGRFETYLIKSNGLEPNWNGSNSLGAKFIEAPRWMYVYKERGYYGKLYGAKRGWWCDFMKHESLYGGMGSGGDG